MLVAVATLLKFKNPLVYGILFAVFACLPTPAFANTSAASFEAEQNTQHKTDQLPSASAIALSASESAWIAGKKTIRVGFDDEWPPYSYRADNGELEGIAVEITRRLAARLDLDLELISHHDWPKMLQQTIDGKIDMVGTLYALPERRDSFIFTRPYLSASSYVVVEQKNSERYSTLSSLSGQKVALVEGNVEAKVALEQVPDIIPEYVANQADALRLVSTGKVTATIVDIASANQTILQLGLINLAFTEDLSSLLDNQKISFAANNQNPMLAALFDKALETLSVAELNSIYSYWNIPQSTRPELGYLTIDDLLSKKEKNWLRKHPVIHLATDSSFQPYDYISGQQTHLGMCADYINLLGKMLNVRFNITPHNSRKALLNAVKNRQQDMLSCASPQSEYTQSIAFSASFIKRPLTIITQDHIGFVGDTYRLKEKSIAVEAGYSAQHYLNVMHPELNVFQFDDAESALDAVSSGKVFAYVGDIAVANNLIRRNGIDNLKVSGELSQELQLSIGVRSDWPELTNIINKGLDAISVAEHEAIHQKWINAELKPHFDTALLWKVGGISALLLLAVLVWNRSLAHQVRERTEQLLQQESYDQLTGLPNRVLAMDRFRQMVKEADDNKTQVAVLLVSIDQFKEITDVIGFEASDQCIAEVADRLVAVVGNGNTVARIGEVDFVMLLGCSSTNEIIGCAERTQATLKNQMACTDQALTVTASIGIAVYPDNATSARGLMQNALSAMQHAKKRGRGCFSFFTDSLNKDMVRRITLEQSMYDAVKHQGFHVHYQPVVDVSTGITTGVEALLRWQHKELGHISPEEFIPIAENNGQIIPLGKFVLRQAILDICEIERRVGHNLKIAVNLSPAQLHNESYLTYLKDLLEELHYPAHKLELEITEGILIESESNIANILNSLHEVGVSLSMDDFGTGYSSLFYLRKYPFDTLKIDKEFVQDMEQGKADNRLVSAATAMGHGLGLEVIAEGVEMEYQFNLLQSINCNYCQGYYFSKPLPANSLEQFLSKHQYEHPVTGMALGNARHS